MNITCQIGRLVTKLGISIALILLVIIAGCTPVKPDPGGATHITLWHGINPPPNRDVFDKLVAKFNREHPQIEVEALYVGQADRQLPKILAAIVGNAKPDLLWYGSMITGQLVDLDALVPIEKWWNRSLVSKDIDPALFGSMQYENHLWSIPFATNNVGIFYRPSLFKAAGIDRLPTNWDEFKATAKQLTRDTDGDGKNDTYGTMLPLGNGEWTVFTWLPFMWSGGGELKAKLPDDPANTPAWTIDKSGAIAALQLWQDLITDGSAILSAPERGYELDSLLAGKVATILNGPWNLGQLASMKFTDYAVLPIPAGKKSATSLGGENLYMMSSDRQHQQAAWEFMEYVLSPEFQTEWALGTGYLPINLQSRQDPRYRDYVAKTPALQVFLDQSKVANSRPIAPGYSRISENLGRAIEAVLLNKSTPQVALDRAQERLNLSFNR